MNIIDNLLAQEIASDPMVLVGGMSRSGTTLLTAVLDAHPRISMGTELIPGEIDPPAALLRKLDSALDLASGDFSRAGRALSKAGDYPVGVFFARCHRGGVALDDVRRVLEQYAQAKHGPVRSWRSRLELAWAMMRTRWQREATATFGFKLNSQSIQSAGRLLPNTQFICIVRDPYDVVFSQLSNGFDKQPSEIVRSWNAVVGAYTDYANAHPGRCRIVRYEDLVRAPRRVLQGAFEILPVEFDPDIVAFQTSDAAVFRATDAARHPNLEMLQRGFVSDKMGLGHEELSDDLRTLVATGTRELASQYGYNVRGMMRKVYAGPLPTSSVKSREDEELVDIDTQLHRRKLREFSSKRRFRIDQYESMLEPYLSSHKVLRLCDYVRLPDLKDDRVLLIRHDIDHDIENAVRIAEWEHRHGIKSTHCILHSAWYYGERRGNKYCHSRLLLESVERILDLGHEINFHNNLLALALIEGVEPVEMLRNELDFWDRRGVPIVGTSMHGDKLCRQLNFRNSELFSECIETRFGGPRQVTYDPQAPGQQRSIDVGQISMFDLGLEYEAYDVARDVYHTDSGGNYKTRLNTRGRRPLGRSGQRGEVVGILTHPVWWDLG